MTARQPPKPLTEKWPVKSRKIPYGKVQTGYYMNPEDGLELLPCLHTMGDSDFSKIELIEQAFDHLENGNALRETSDWLSQKIHESVTHQTLRNLYNKHRKPFVRYQTNKIKGKPHAADTKKLISAKVSAALAVKKAVRQEQLNAKKRLRLKPEDFPEGKPEPKTFTEPVFKEPGNEQIKYGFVPNPGPQTEFLQATELEVLYGGSAGGGKSYAMIADPMRYFKNPNFVGLLIRRTNDELRELIREQNKLYPRVFIGAKFKEQAGIWKFPSGAELWMSYLDRDEDVHRYQGQSFCWIGVDELTQYATPFAWEYLKSRLRSSDPELQKSLAMRATTNPGGPGHQWVKKMFIDPAPPNTPFWATDIETGEVKVYPNDYKIPELRGQPLNERLFIPARLSDNPYLNDDGTYERNLLGLPEAQRRKLLDGDWSVTEGAAFPEFNPKIHIYKDFNIPRSWIKFRCGDFGYSSYSAVLWIAIEPGTSKLYVYRELYVSKKTGVDLAMLVMEAEKNETVSYGILDSSVWHQRGQNGPSIAEEMIARGCRWRKSDRGDGSRVSGKNRLHELLKVDPYTDEPGIVFHESCRQLIADLPMIPSDPKGGDDIDDRYKSDHTYDALRYGIMSRPKSSNPFGWGSDMPEKQYKPVNKVFGY